MPLIPFSNLDTWYGPITLSNISLPPMYRIFMTGLGERLKHLGDLLVVCFIAAVIFAGDSSDGCSRK